MSDYVSNQDGDGFFFHTEASFGGKTRIKLNTNFKTLIQFICQFIFSSRVVSFQGNLGACMGLWNWPGHSTAISRNLPRLK